MNKQNKKTEDFDFNEKFNEEFGKARSSIKKPNILVLGGIGAGKSSLVNLVFGEKLAKVGAGYSVTKGIDCYENDLVRIYDSQGYESGEEGRKNYKEKVLGFLNDESIGLDKCVHIAWYCISLANHRLFDVDIETINAIFIAKKPIAVIFTQADQVSEVDSEKLHAELKNNCPGVSFFEISTDPSMNLTVDPVISWACENLDEALREGFISGAKNAIIQKRNESRRVVAQHVASAGTIAASPIPFSDAPLLIANQIAMTARLASIWDLPAIKAVAANGILSQAISQFGRSIAGNLVKLIPGAGSIGGGLINASIASAITGAIGYGIIEICENITNDEISGIKKSILEYFNEDVLSALIKAKMGKF